MSAQDLAHALMSDEAFVEELQAIALHTAASDLPRQGLPFGPGVRDWFRLLRSASVLLDSDEEVHCEAGLRIVHGCLLTEGADRAKAFAAALLAKAASRPTIEVAIRRELVPADVLERLPVALSLDVRARTIAATLNIDTVTEFVGNEFQSKLWRALLTHDWISASAPTSAGKSFVLEKWIEHAVRTKPTSNTFYVVPTRALISQVENNLRTNLAGAMVSITSLPLGVYEPAAHNIFVYTQERLHLYLLNSALSVSADLIVIDEAQQIGASRRGVLLQQVLELCARTFQKAKVLFASPSTRNPESLLQFAPPGRRTTSVSGVRPTVSQNLVWVEPTPGKPTLWTLSLMVDGAPSIMRTLELKDRPSIRQKLPFIAEAIGGSGGGNVIYVNRASDAEEVAEILCQFQREKSDDPELNALSELCEKAVHRKFKLRRHVRKGVAFHYGNIPQLIRSEVERLFSSGKIRFLVCTSTLVEGVNLSCKNIFLRNPKRGNTALMSVEDFWNLAGRAGRWGREFQGNIYCLDPRKSGDWVGGEAPRSKQKSNITIATQRLGPQFENFMAYAEEGARQLKSKDRFFEHLLAYLVFRRSEFGTLTGAPALAGLASNQVDRLTATIDETVAGLGLSDNVIKRNPGINPWGLSRLRDYFLEKPDDALAKLLPLDPLSDAPVGEDDAAADAVGDGETERVTPSDAVVDNLIAIFTRMSKYLEAPLGAGSSAYANAKLVAQWIRGYPLNRIIDGQIRYWSRKDPRKSETAVIRETLERVETVARFQAPKYLHAYLDILRLVLKERGQTDVLPTTDEFWLYLEFGVSKRTQLSLMSLGLSRSSAIALSVFITRSDLSESECIRWFLENDWDEYDLPRLTEIEIRAALKRRGVLAK